MLALALVLGCQAALCGGGEALAVLRARQGDVQRDSAASVGAWSPADPGTRFQVGDGLRTGLSGRAELALATDGVAMIEANTLLRFLDRDPRAGGRRIALETGSVRIDAGRLALDVHMPTGLARVRKGSAVRIVSSGHDATLDVLVGRVALDTSAGERELSAGQKLALGPVQTEARGPTTREAAVDAPALDAAAPESETPTPVAEPTPPEAKAPADLALDTLEAMTLHAPSLPVAVRLALDGCAEGKLELDGRVVTSSPTEPVVTLAAARSYRVRLSCPDRPRMQSVIRVVRDAASSELPRSAPRVEVEADGRRYTVRYQNVLPVVRVRWSEARAAKSYVLTVRHGARERSYRGSAPERELSSAELDEGSYTFWFSDASGHKSAASTLRIEFDNTARALSLSEPVEGSAAASTTTVSGVALLRSRVWANGVPLALDAKGRFRSQVPVGRERSVLVRAVHPAAGVHYYLRRLR